MCLNTHGLPWFDCVTHWIWHLYISAMPCFFCFFCIMGLWVLLKYNTTHWKNIYVIWCFHIQTTLFSCLPFWLFYIKQPCFIVFTNLTVLYQAVLFSRVYKSDCFISSSLVFSCLQSWLFYIKQPCFLMFTSLTVLYQAALFSNVYKAGCFISSSLVFSCLQIWLIDIKYPCFSCLQLFHIKQRIVRVYRYYSYISSIHVSRVNKSDFISNIIVSHVTLCFSSFQIWLF